jgi:AcrR family transcriptional regulator
VARTQAADYDDRRAAMTDMAATLFAEAGFLGSSMADLAVACGISKSLLYHYFPSKEDILFEIMAEHVEALGDMARAVPPGPPEARLLALTSGFLGLYRDASARHKVLVNDLGKLPEPRRAEIVEAERALLDIVDRSLAEASPALAADPSRRRAAVMLYFGMINWTHTWYDPDGPLDTEALAELVTQTMLKGAV